MEMGYQDLFQDENSVSDKTAQLSFTPLNKILLSLNQLGKEDQVEELYESSQENLSPSLESISTAKGGGYDERINVECDAILRSGNELPLDEDALVETARLKAPQEAGDIIFNVLKKIPTSKKLWIAMAELVDDKKSKFVILKSALQHIRYDAELWELTINGAEPEEAKVLLRYAIRSFPKEVRFRSAFEKLENYDDVRMILDSDREEIPAELTLGADDAKLKEAAGKLELIPKLLQQEVIVVNKHAGISREILLDEAGQSELSRALVTAGTIIKQH